jgi:hypothetical protein
MDTKRKGYGQEVVFDILKEEREYQDSLWTGKHSVGEEILLMEQYMHDARESWVKNKGDTAALDIIRKVTAMGIRCMENNGVISRK